jgi:biotin carboxyl carrier protein
MTVTINSRPYAIEVEQLTASQATVTVNGKPYQVHIEAEELVAVPAEAAGAVPEPIVRKVPVPQETPAPTGPAGPRVQQVNAPMPGNILNIAVRPGDRVKLGQRLCSLEAMKMNNAIRSPRDGVIATVEVTEGQVVSHSDVLFTFQ